MLTKSKTLLCGKKEFENYLLQEGANRSLISERSVASFFEKVNNGSLSAGPYSEPRRISKMEFLRKQMFDKFWIEYLTENILLQKYISLQKRNAASLCFFFLCFSFQTRKDLALVKFYNATVRRFSKTYGNVAEKILWCKPLKVST